MDDSVRRSDSGEPHRKFHHWTQWAKPHVRYRLVLPLIVLLAVGCEPSWQKERRRIYKILPGTWETVQEGYGERVTFDSKGNVTEQTLIIQGKELPNQLAAEGQLTYSVGSWIDAPKQNAIFFYRPRNAEPDPRSGKPKPRVPEEIIWVVNSISEQELSVTHMKTKPGDPFRMDFTYKRVKQPE